MAQYKLDRNHYEQIFKQAKFEQFFNENLKNVLLKCENFYVGFVTEHESDDENGFLEVLGRFDHSDLRGCNLLVQ